MTKLFTNKIYPGQILDQFIVIVTLIGIFSLTFPYMTHAQHTGSQPLIFEVDSAEYLRNIAAGGLHPNSADFPNSREPVDLAPQADKLRAYLESKGSPLAPYADILVRQPDFKRILGLANAESGLCKHFPAATNNCWGVGGANLWKMGDDLGEAVVEMQNFLDSYPRRSPVKYKDWTIDRMNGVYKQPAGAHWAFNINHTVAELETLGL